MFSHVGYSSQFVNFSQNPQTNYAWINGADSKKKSHKSSNHILPIADSSQGREKSLMKNAIDEIDSRDFLPLIICMYLVVFITLRGKGNWPNLPQTPPWRRPGGQQGH